VGLPGRVDLVTRSHPRESRGGGAAKRRATWRSF
jgi:hypothetical protein